MGGLQPQHSQSRNCAIKQNSRRGAIFCCQRQAHLWDHQGVEACQGFHPWTTMQTPRQLRARGGHLHKAKLAPREVLHPLGKLGGVVRPRILLCSKRAACGSATNGAAPSHPAGGFASMAQGSSSVHGQQGGGARGGSRRGCSTHSERGGCSGRWMSRCPPWCSSSCGAGGAGVPTASRARYQAGGAGAGSAPAHGATLPCSGAPGTPAGALTRAGA